MRFLSLYEVALYFYKSTIWPCLKYYCHVWAGALSCYVKILDKAQKWICRAVGPYLAASLEPLSSKCSQLKSFCRYYFGRCSSELAELVTLPHSGGRSTCYPNRLHDFPVTIPKCYKDLYTNNFWTISFPAECFPLTCGLNGFKSRVNRHFFTSFTFFFLINSFSISSSSFFFLLFLVTPSFVVAV